MAFSAAAVGASQYEGLHNQTHGPEETSNLGLKFQSRVETIICRQPQPVAMTVLFGTLGWHPSKFLDAIPRAGETIERVVIYTGSTGEEERRNSRRSLQVVTETLDAMHLPLEHRDIANPWDFTEILRTFLSDLREGRPDETLFNLTGGPKTMTVAATVACLLLGVRALYVPEELEGGGVPVELPLFRVRYSDMLTERQQEVLRVIREEAPESLDELAGALRRANATVTFHVQRLQDLGAVTLVPHPGSRLVRTPKLTPAGEIMLMAEQILDGTRKR